MMKKQQYRFPTIGEIVKELFNAAGLLPQKHSLTSIIVCEKHKKSIQKSLERLAKEDSKIGEQLDDTLDILANILYELIEDEEFTLAFMASIQDALEQYKDLVRGDGTYLSLANSIKWVIQNRLVDRLLTSLFKNTLAFQVAVFQNEIPDDQFWWLPDFDSQSNKWNLPITKVWQWIYYSRGASQTHFHNPVRGDISYQCNKLLLEKYKQYERNLEVAQRWTSGIQLPSTHTLFKNLNDSLAAQSYCFDGNERQLKCYKAMLFISRLTTYCSNRIQETYGDDVLHQLVRDLKKQYGRYEKETSGYRYEVEKHISTRTTRHSDYVNAWGDLTRELWWYRADDLTKRLPKVEEYLRRHGALMSKHNQIKFLVNNLGSSNVYSLMNQERYSPREAIPTRFPELFVRGLNIKKQAVLLQEIQEYRTDIESAGLQGLLCWVVEWAFATYYYRQEIYDKAHLHYIQAFQLARYTAGNQQYALVNQYIESCAKAKDYKGFKKAIAWANYLGIKVRWLRGMDDPEAEKNLRCVYQLMQQARYWQL
ncbi:hypothetical protein BS015_RS19545 [Vibrio parahaemolyticus]|uniref:hypothetical protein n=2 Tax=Vibrionaceae TaxID=641 RepID=UPI00158202C3|nr:hypothetical protein [Vibrio vulnificus]EJC6868147.1 hypothetical protein [Vibrio parahaemolyticus]QKU62663.1 hypothetical protein HPY17_04700 [Vibrio cholerae]EJC6964122.1 hypothetical protein [Vibrio parahaemolyticus]EJC7011134.1 hypothetical protein [Vibrio parahaemolyticus]EJC7117821.1 hypothetical protein [Vibrio parahaemolyticus]